MSVVFSCPHCRVSLKLNAALPAGQSLACPRCQATFTPPNAAAEPPTLPMAEPIGSAAPLPEATPIAAGPPAAAPVAGGVVLQTAVTTAPQATARGWPGKAHIYIDRGSCATGLDAATFAPVAVGLAAAVLLLIAACFSWYSFATDARVFGTPIREVEWFAGISYLEGKLVFIGTLAVGVWIAMGIGRKPWLPGALLAAGAVLLFGVVILLGLRFRLAAAFAEVRREQAALSKFISGNPITKSLEGVSKEMDTTLVPTLSGGPGWALWLAILLSLIATAAFAVASRRRPLVVSFFEKPGTAPVVQRYGSFATAFGLAFLLGIIVVVIRH